MKLRKVMYEDIKVGDTMIIEEYNKEVLVVAKTDSKVVVRYLTDVNGGHPTRCYLYDAEDLGIEEQYGVLTIFCLEIYKGVKFIGALPCGSYPTEEAITKHLINYEGTDARVVKKYKLVRKGEVR